MNERDPGPAEEPPEEPSHPWGSDARSFFDWDEERARQKEEGELFVESDEDRIERLRSILP